MAKEDIKKTLTLEELQKRLEVVEQEKAELRAKLLEGEEGALRRVAKAAGLDPSEITDKETTPVEDLVHVEMGRHEVNIQGQTFRGNVKVPRSVAQVINQAIGDKRMRLLREMTGNDYLVEDIAGVGMRSRVVGKVNTYGEEI